MKGLRNGLIIMLSLASALAVLLPSCGSSGGSSTGGGTPPNTTYTLSGTVTAGGNGLQGVTMTLNTAATAITDSSGNYAFGNLADGSYTVTPSKTGYTFSPTSATVTVNNANATGKDFTATAAGSNAGVSARFPIATRTNRELSIGGAFDGTNYLVGIEGDSYSPEGISAQLVSQSGTTVGPLISLGTTCSPQPQPNCGGAPVVSFDGTNYLLVWEEDADVSTHLYGRFIGKDGSLVGSIFQVATGTSIEKDGPWMLFDGTNYLVYWADDSTPGQGDSADIYGQFITPAGSLLGSPIAIANAAHGQREAAAAVNGNTILVVWVDGRNQDAVYSDTSGTYNYESDLYGQFITKSSASAAGTLSGANFKILPGTLPRDNPIGIAFDGTNYLVTFMEESNIATLCTLSTGCNADSGGIWNTYGQLVTAGGAASGAKISIGNSTASNFLAIPVYDGTNYLVSWTEGLMTSSASINGQYFDTSGNPVGSSFVINNDPGDLIGFVGAYNNGKFFGLVDTGDSFDDPAGDVYGVFITP